MAERRKLFGDFLLPATGLKDAFLPPDDDARTKTSELEEDSEEQLPPLRTASFIPKTATCEGCLLGIEHDRIIGWAWDTAVPHEFVDVELYVGDVRVGHGRADRYDAGLAEKNGGDGMHRFELGLMRIPEAPPPYTIRAVIAGTEKELGPQLSLESLIEAERLLAGSEYIGKITGIAAGNLCGWILNQNNPNEQPQVTLYDGNMNVLSRYATERVRVVLESGAKTRAYRFDLPLPASALDGLQHSFSARVGSPERDISGSPVMFGPSDLASLGRNLSFVSERLQQLDERLDSFQPELDRGVLERTITTRVLERVDMLLNIHRDSLERELAVLRRQVDAFHAPKPESTTDVIRPIAHVPTVRDIAAPTAREFSIEARAVPLATYNLQTASEDAIPSGALVWAGAGSAKRVSIGGDGKLQLKSVPKGLATLVVRGTGAQDPLEFCGIVPRFCGRPLSGRVEVDEKGNWTFIGTTLEGAAGASDAEDLAFAYLRDLAQPGGFLSLNEVSVFGPRRAPDRIERAAPQASIVYLGPENQRGGWYAPEAGPRGGSCWMAGNGELSFRICQTGKYRLTMPEVRPLVGDFIPKLQIFVNGAPINTVVSSKDGDATAFKLTADFVSPFQESDTVRIRLSFPRDCVKSPMELGLNDDQRLLTICMRSVALRALGR